MKELLYRGRLLIYACMTAVGGAVGCSGKASQSRILIMAAAGCLLSCISRRFGWRAALLFPCLCFLCAGLYIGQSRFAAWEGRGGPAGEASLLGRVEVGRRGEREDVVDLFRVTGVVSGAAAREGDLYLLRNRDKEAPATRWGDTLSVRGPLYLFDRENGGVGGSLVAEEVSVLRHTGNPLLQAALAYRRILSEKADEELDPPEAGLIKGMVLGDYRSLHDPDLKAFRRTGLVHLCAASGLHLGILAGLIVWMGRRARLSRRAVLALQVPLLMLFALAVGLSVPVIRAMVVVLFADAAYFLGRDFDILPAMGLAVLYLVWRDPEAAVGISFQLCFAAALGMALLYRPLGELLGGGASRTLALLAATLAAQLAVGPILLYHFGEVSILAAFSNLLALPLVPVVMVLAMLSSLLEAAGLPLAGLSMQAAGVFARWILAVARALSGPAWVSLRIFPLSILWMAAYYPSLALALLARGRWRKPGVVILATLLSMALLFGLVMPARPLGADAGVRITFLDVGQGDAVLVQAPSGTTVLVDGGMRERVLAQDLRSRGVSRIDVVVVSHPDSDHIGGLEGALQGCEVGMLVHPATKTTGQAGELLALAEGLGVQVHTMRAGDCLRIGEIALDAFAPPRELPESVSSNEYSLVLRAEGPGFSLLLPGDVEEEGESMLMRGVPDISCDILKVPHHGGFCETSEEFFALVSPVIAVISVGEDNPFGHPALSTIEALERMGCAVYRTDRCGDIVIRVVEGGYRVEFEKSAELQPSFAKE
jgi:competence protein ComEC